MHRVGKQLWLVGEDQPGSNERKSIIFELVNEAMPVIPWAGVKLPHQRIISRRRKAAVNAIFDVCRLRVFLFAVLIGHKQPLDEWLVGQNVPRPRFNVFDRQAA